MSTRIPFAGYSRRKNLISTTHSSTRGGGFRLYRREFHSPGILANSIRRVFSFFNPRRRVLSVSTRIPFAGYSREFHSPGILILQPAEAGFVCVDANSIRRVSTRILFAGYFMRSQFTIPYHYEQRSNRKSDRSPVATCRFNLDDF